jgi:hypothetical protein
MFKWIFIGNEKGKLHELGDVLAVARSIGKKVLKTHKAVDVLVLAGSPEFGWAAVVADSLAQAKQNET